MSISGKYIAPATLWFADDRGGNIGVGHQVALVIKFPKLRSRDGSVICTDVDGLRNYHTEQSKSRRQKQISYINAYNLKLKKSYRRTYLQSRNRDTENKRMDNNWGGVGWTGRLGLTLIDCCCSVTKLCPTLCSLMNCSWPGFFVLHYPPEFAQAHLHWVGDTTLTSYPLSFPSPPVLNLSQHQGLIQWLSSLHQVAKVLEFQLQHQSFQWTPRTDLL